MEAAAAGDDQRLVLRDPLLLVAPLARDLERRFHAFGPRVHWQHHLVPKDGRQLLGKATQLVVVKRAAAQTHALHLVDHRLHDLRVAVALQAGG